MQYHEHELNSDLLSKTPADPNALKVGLTAEGRAAVELTERELQEQRDAREAALQAEAGNVPATGEGTEDTGPQVEGEITPVREVVITTLSLADGKRMLDLTSDELAAGEDEVALRQHFIRVIEPIRVTPEDLNRYYDIAQNDQFYDRLAVVLPSLIQTGTPIWKAVDRRLTRFMRQALDARLSTPGWGFISFAEDYLPLSEQLGQHYGSSFIDLFEQTATHVLPATFSELSDEAVTSVCEVLIALGVPITNELANQLIVLDTFYSITRLPLAYHDIEGFLTTGILRPSEVCFHRLIRSIVNYATEVNGGLAGRNLVTLTTGETYEIVLSSMVDDVFVWRKFEE